MSKGRLKLGQTKIYPTSKKQPIVSVWQTFSWNLLLSNIRADVDKQIDMH